MGPGPTCQQEKPLFIEVPLAFWKKEMYAFLKMSGPQEQPSDPYPWSRSRDLRISIWVYPFLVLLTRLFATAGLRPNPEVFSGGVVVVLS